MERSSPAPASSPQQTSLNSGPYQFVIFRLDNRRFGLRLSVVERVIRAVEITPLPNAPEVIHGLVNMQGEIIYVVNTRKALGLPDREIDLSDQFIIARASGRFVALITDEVSGVKEFRGNEIKVTEDLSSHSWCIYGFAKTEDDVIVILDLDCMLSRDLIAVVDGRVGGSNARL